MLLKGHRCKDIHPPSTIASRESLMLTLFHPQVGIVRPKTPSAMLVQQYLMIPLQC